MWEFVFSFHPVHPKTQTQAIRLCSQHLHQLSYFSSPDLLFFCLFRCDTFIHVSYALFLCTPSLSFFYFIRTLSFPNIVPILSTPTTHVHRHTHRHIHRHTDTKSCDMCLSDSGLFHLTVISVPSISL